MDPVEGMLMRITQAFSPQSPASEQDAQKMTPKQEEKEEKKDLQNDFSLAMAHLNALNNVYIAINALYNNIHQANITTTTSSSVKQEDQNTINVEKNELDSKELLKNRVKNNYYSHLKLLMISKYFSHSKNKKIGQYTLEERMEKIIKFKLKQYKHREKFPTVRNFKGRSEVAKIKKRAKGRFVKEPTSK